MEKGNKKEKHTGIFVSIVILTLIALAVPIAAGGWTSDAPITVDTVVKKEGTGSIKVTSNQSVGWINDSSLESGLSPALYLIAPEVFEKDSVWYLITTDYTDFYGYNWTGSTWQSDSGIISGLYSFNDIFSTAVFYKDSTWYLIADNDTGYCYGYNWTGSVWQNDSAIVSGMDSILDNYAAIDVFQKDGIWYLIAGNGGGTFTGYNWSGTTWQSDSAIVSGLGDVGSYGNPSVFYKDSKWYLIAGENAGNFFGFNWSGSTWVSDSDITEGLYDIGSCPYPNAFMGGVDFGDETWYLLAVEEGNGYWRGFNWMLYTPTCYFQNDFSPPISVTNVSKNTGYLALWYFIYDSSKINSNVKISIYTDDSNYMYWEVSKTYFDNNWSEVYLPMSEGTEVGTLSLSSVSKFKLEIPGTEDPDMVHRVDYMRFVEYPYTLHNIYLELETDYGGGAGTYFPATHLVRFFVQDIYGNSKQNVEVTATCVQTTMGTLGWLYSIFGFKNTTYIENSTMTGTTDSAGSISFLMVETIKYNLHFENTSQSINENLTIYPKSERYTVIVGRTGFFDVEPQLFGDEIDWNFTMERIDETDAWLNFSYNDTLGQTTSGSYYVYMVNETTGLEKINTSNVTYFCSTPVSIDSNVWSYNCIVYDYRGKTYILGFNATHTTAGEFKEAVSIFFRYNHPLIQFEGWTTGYYQFLSIALLIFLSMLFTGVTIKMGCVILPLSAWGLYGIGWFSPTSDLVTSAILLGIATAIGIGVYMTTTGREKNLAS